MTPSRSSLRWIALVLAIVAAGCSEGGPVCPQSVSAGIHVSVSDGAAQAALTGATGEARDGEYVEVLTAVAPQSVQLTGAYGRPGTYVVEVQRDGYVPWVRGAVVVVSTGGDCPDVETTFLQAALVPVAP